MHVHVDSFVLALNYTMYFDPLHVVHGGSIISPDFSLLDTLSPSLQIHACHRLIVCELK